MTIYVSQSGVGRCAVHCKKDTLEWRCVPRWPFTIISIVTQKKRRWTTLEIACISSDYFESLLRRKQGPLAVTTSTWTSTTGSWKTNHDATTHAQTSTSSSSTPRWGRHLPPFDVLWWTWVLLDLFSSIFWLNFAISWIPRFFLVDKTEAVSYSCCCEVKNPDFFDVAGKIWQS